MDEYVRQLIDILRLAIDQAPEVKDEPVNSDESFIEHIEEVERILGEPSKKLSEILDVSPSLFPHQDKLNEQQMAELAKEMINLMQAYNFYPNIPEEVPTEMLYAALLKNWEAEVVFSANSPGIMELCDYDDDNCPFPGYCDVCKNVENDLEEMSEDMLPDDLGSRVESDKPVRTNVDDSGFIPGVYNYCDRWCERCDFTEVCRTFSMEKEFERIYEKREEKAEELGVSVDELDQDIRDELMEVFEKDFEKDDVEDEDDSGDEPIGESFLDSVDFDMDPDDYEDPRKDFFSAHNKAERHPLNALVEKFMDDSNAWIEPQYKEVEKNFTKYVAIGDTDELMEAFEVIMRYHFFIPVKLKRALTGYFEQFEDEFEAYDMNGTAKVMLIAIDDSIAALKVLKRFFKDKKDILDQLIAQLTEILNQAEALFPDARAFVRPGLDE